MVLGIQIDNDVPGMKRTMRIRLDGRLDTATSPQFERELGPLLDGRVDNLIFDLAKLEFISSAGVRVFVQARKVMWAQHGGVLMVNTQPQILKAFEIIRALVGVQVFKSEAELDAHLAEMQRRMREKGSLEP